MSRRGFVTVVEESQEDNGRRRRRGSVVVAVVKSMSLYSEQHQAGASGGRAVHIETSDALATVMEALSNAESRGVVPSQHRSAVCITRLTLRWQMHCRCTLIQNE